MGKSSFARVEDLGARFPQRFPEDLHIVLPGVLHRFSTESGFLKERAVLLFAIMKVFLAIDFLLNLGDLVAKGEIKLKVVFDFLDAVHDGSMIFDTDFGGDFIGA